MYPNFISDRKYSGYNVSKDTSCGITLVIIVDSTAVRLIKPIKSNQQFIKIKELSCKVKRKSKRIIAVIFIGVVIWFNNGQPAEPIGLPILRPTPIELVQSNCQHPYEMNVAPTVIPKVDKVTLREVPVYIYMIDEKFLKTSQATKLINKIRGGSSFELAVALILIVIIWQMQIVGFQIEGFVPKNQNAGWGLNRPNPFQPNRGPLRYPPVYDVFFPPKTTDSGSMLEIDRPTAMPHNDFVSLTKEERRALPHSNDMKIIHEGRPELEVGWWQSKFKVGDHGAAHDLPYTIRASGGTKTEKSDDNTLKMMQSIVDMPNRPNIQWFEDATYQGGTDREFEAIHLYDPDTKVIAVFKKTTGKFVTTCQLNLDEQEELVKTSNFGGGEGWFSGQVRNLPPQQTAVNSFENDVMGITPVSPINENSSSGFTPTSGFENDVMGITPIDKSQFNNP